MTIQPDLSHRCATASQSQVAGRIVTPRPAETVSGPRRSARHTRPKHCGYGELPDLRGVIESGPDGPPTRAVHGLRQRVRKVIAGTLEYLAKEYADELPAIAEDVRARAAKNLAAA